MSPSATHEESVTRYSSFPDDTESEVSLVETAPQPVLRDSRARGRFRQGGEGGENEQDMPLPHADMARYGRSEHALPARGASERGVARDREGRKVRGLFCWWCVGEICSTAASWQWRPFRG